MTDVHKRKKKDQDIHLGKKYSLHSKVLNEERPYWVNLPASYDEENQERSYPVLYLLDGDGHFPSASGVLHFMSSGLNGNTQIPEMILVAILNTERTRDLSPTHSTLNIHGEKTADFESSGGGDAFLRFLREELFPEIDAKFHTAPSRILVGHSFGGLLAIHTLLSQPDMFHGYIAIDPSLWWDDQVLTRRATDRIQALRKLGKSVYITSANTQTLRRSRRIGMRPAIRKFVQMLESARSKDFRLGFQYFKAEDHGSVPLLSLYHGLLFIFEGFKREGVETFHAMQARFKKLSKRLGGEIRPAEGYVNTMGYAMLYGKKDMKRAMEFFEYNVAQFPKAWNVYDSLAEAYMVKGDIDRAIANYEKSIELDPNNLSGARALQELKEKKEKANTASSGPRQP